MSRLSHLRRAVWIADLTHPAEMLAGIAGVSADEAAKEWAANVVPGITIIPSGTWGVNRAQEAGCTYCAGG